MTSFNVLLATAAGVVLLLGLVSGLTKRNLPVSEPMLAIAAGFAIGPHGVGWLRLESLGDPHVLLEQVARLTVAIAVVTAAVRLPKGFFTSRLAGGPALALGPGMVLMWAVSSLLAWTLLDVTPWVAVLIGAIVTPTDPVLAGSIVTGRFAEANLPVRVRSLLSGESGANDGLGLLFVMLPLLMMSHPPAEALRTWFIETWLWEVAAAVLLGVLIGWAAGRLLHTAHAHGLTSENSMITMTLALAFVSVALVKLIGSDGILAAFAAGAVFPLDTSDRTDEENEHFQESVKRFFEMPVFVLFGLALPVTAFLENPWPLAATAAAVLLLRRPPAFWLLARGMPQAAAPRDRLFIAWFGPIGIAALFYAMVAMRHGAPEIVWHVAAATILGSAIVHGATATPATRAYGRIGGADA